MAKTLHKKEVEDSEVTEQPQKYNLPQYAVDRLDKIKDPARKLKYKITLARKLFLDQNKSKSGSNNFQNFDYFELKDIVPDAIEICTILGLEYDFVLGKRRGVLTVSDVESDANIKYPKERPAIKEGGNINQQLQGIGKTSTYLKRYCLMDFLEVVEADKVDKEDNRKNVPKSAPKKTAPRKSKNGMNISEVQEYVNQLPADTDIKKELGKLKLEKKINQAVYNRMIELMQKQGD